MPRSSSSSSSYRARLVLTLWTATTVACVAVPAEDGGDEAETETQEAIGAGCSSPRRYYAVLADRACAEIPGRRGRWVARPAFADGPAESPACVLEWSGERWSRADRDALFASTSPADVLTPACGAGASAVVGGVREVTTPEFVGQGGSVGCDVCGVVDRGRLWSILDPDRIARRRVRLSLSDGTSKTFQIDAPAEARAVSVDLPVLPAGLSYRSGPVSIE